MEDLIFHGHLDRIGQLEAVAAEELDAVVAPGIVGGGDDHAGLKSMCPGEEGDGRSGDNPRAYDARSCFAQAGSESGRDPGTGLAGVAPQNNLGLRAVSLRSGAGSECPRARPAAKMVVGSRGASPAMARMPSVPNSLRARADSWLQFLILFLEAGRRGAVASTRLVKSPSERRVTTVSPVATCAVERTSPPAASRTRA